MFQYNDASALSPCQRDQYSRVCVHTQHVSFREVHGRSEEVRNRARPEASIAKGYGTEEVIEFCVEFIEDLLPIGVPEDYGERGLSEGKQ